MKRRIMAVLATSAALLSGCGMETLPTEPVENSQAATSAPISLWPSSAVPSVIAADSSSIELGMKFKTTVPGRVTGVRFYKASTNTGTHIGHLWSESGNLLGSVTFTNETAFGWQSATFASPIAVQPNTVYVVSYFAPNGRYAGENGYFASAGRSSGPLYALRNGESGGNGVYQRSTNGGFPTSTYNANNYYVDVLFVSNVAGTGLTGEYFGNEDLTELKLTRVDPQVAFDWAAGSPHSAIASDNFSVRWTGRVLAPVTGMYTFSTTSDDGARLWVNGQKLVDNWTLHAATTNSGQVALTAGELYDLKLEYFEHGGVASIVLSWAVPGRGTVTIPSSQLFPNGSVPVPNTAAGGVTGQYFGDENLTNLLMTRTDSQVDFNWDSGSPAPTVSPDNFSVRWTGQVLAPVTGTYTFSTTSDDGVRLWVNGQKLIDNWTLHATTTNSGQVALTAGERYDLKLEYFEHGGVASINLSWTVPGQGSMTIPSSQLVAVSSPTPPPSISVDVNPDTASILSGSTAQFAAIVTGSSDGAVTWSVLEGSAGGTVSATGLYTATATAGTYHVVAASRADPSKTSSATVTVTSNMVDVRSFGAVGDGRADDTAAFQAAADTKKPIYVPRTSGYYRLTNGIRIYNSISGQPGGGKPQIRMASPDGTWRDSILSVVNSTTPLVIEGLDLHGGWDGVQTGGEHSHSVRLASSANVTVRDNNFQYSRGDFVYVSNLYGGTIAQGARVGGPCRNIRIENNTGSYVFRCAVAVIHVDGLVVDRNTFNKHNSYVNLVDIEPNPGGFDYVTNVTFSNNTFNSYDPSRSVILFWQIAGWTAPPAPNSFHSNKVSFINNGGVAPLVGGVRRGIQIQGVFGWSSSGYNSAPFLDITQSGSIWHP